jgi:S1-C subfamily serine protease
MGYAEKTAYYRSRYAESVRKGDGEGARLNAIMYAKTLREMAESCSDYKLKATLTAQAMQYERLAALAGKGKTDGIKRTAVSGAEWSADVFESRVAATLTISTETGNGTGVFISDNGFALTNHHVVHDGAKRNHSIRAKNGDGKINATVDIITADKKRDVALIKVNTGGEKTPFIPFVSDFATVRPGIDVVAIGNALSYGLAPITGTVKFAHASDDNDLIYTAPANHGDSGGPVLNRLGECVGINKSITVSQVRSTGTIRTYGLTNATAADELQQFLEKWKKEFGLKF